MLQEVLNLCLASLVYVIESKHIPDNGDLSFCGHCSNSNESSCGTRARGVVLQMLESHGDGTDCHSRPKE